MLKDNEIIIALDKSSGRKKSEITWDVVVQRIAKFVTLEIEKANSLEALEKRAKVNCIFKINIHCNVY